MKTKEEILQLIAKAASHPLLREESALNERARELISQELEKVKAMITLAWPVDDEEKFKIQLSMYAHTYLDLNATPEMKELAAQLNEIHEHLHFGGQDAESVDPNRANAEVMSYGYSQGVQAMVADIQIRQELMILISQYDLLIRQLELTSKGAEEAQRLIEKLKKRAESLQPLIERIGSNMIQARSRLVWPNDPITILMNKYEHGWATDADKQSIQAAVNGIASSEEKIEALLPQLSFIADVVRIHNERENEYEGQANQTPAEETHGQE